MKSDVEYTDEFGVWWQALSEKQQDDIAAIVELLAEKGAVLPHLYSSGVQGSRYEHMRELRVQSSGDPIRIFYAFDPRRAAILLIGGDKTGSIDITVSTFPLPTACMTSTLKNCEGRA